MTEDAVADAADGVDAHVIDLDAENPAAAAALPGERRCGTPPSSGSSPIPCFGSLVTSDVVELGSARR